MLFKNNAENYGQYEDGNQMTFEDFQDYIDLYYPDNEISVRDHIVKDMKDMVIRTYKCAHDKIFNDWKSSFEIYGYDFIIDCDFKTWLLEVNVNPWLELSSGILQALIPRMIDDALKLTIDVIFKEKRNKQRFEKDEQLRTFEGAKYPVEGYPDSENMWELLL